MDTCCFDYPECKHEHVRLRNAIVFGGSLNEKISELEHRIEYGKRQFIIFQTYAMLVQSEIISGAYKLRDTAQGRAVTPEEKERGESIGWRKHTDEEKLKNALNTMKRHIQNMSEVNDNIDENRRELEKVISKDVKIRTYTGAKLREQK